MLRKHLEQRLGIILPVVAVSIVGSDRTGGAGGRHRPARRRQDRVPGGGGLRGDRRRAKLGWHPESARRDQPTPSRPHPSCKILGETIPSGEVTVNHGSYHYDVAAQKFTPQIPAVAPDNYNLTQVTVTHVVNLTFARVLGRTMATVSATSTAAHRPRDIAIVLDYSGSMNNESDLWNNESYLGSANNSSNNTDPIFPQWGPYNPTFSPNALMQCTSSDSRVGMCNVTQSVAGIPPLVNDFFQNNFGGSGVGAFTSGGSTVTRLQAATAI